MFDDSSNIQLKSSTKQESSLLDQGKVLADSFDYKNEQ